MPATITTDQVWNEIEKHFFAVLGMVTSKGEARTAGVVYLVRGRQVYIGTSKTAWKVRHIQQNPHVSLTVTIPKRIPFLPFLPIPPAAITFQGHATVQQGAAMDREILDALFKGMEIDDQFIADSCLIRIEPSGDFVTYGVGVSMKTMRNPEKSGGRVSVTFHSRSSGSFPCCHIVNG
jgi:uncharacterized pyridoxamine 5'-phosphate oxidase family protein